MLISLKRNRWNSMNNHKDWIRTGRWLRIRFLVRRRILAPFWNRCPGELHFIGRKYSRRTWLMCSWRRKKISWRKFRWKWLWRKRKLRGPRTLWWTMPKVAIMCIFHGRRRNKWRISSTWRKRTIRRRRKKPATAQNQVTIIKIKPQAVCTQPA